MTFSISAGLITSGGRQTQLLGANPDLGRETENLTWYIELLILFKKTHVKARYDDIRT